MRKRSLKWGSAGAGLVAALASTAVDVEAAGDSRRVIRTGRVGLTADQSSYLHIQFHGSGSEASGNCNNGEGWQYSDRSNLHAHVGPVTLAAGETAVASFDASTAGLPAGARLVVYGEVRVPANCLRDTTVSLEIVDTATGKVQAVVTGTPR
jgi:hypothetical protein